MLAVNAHGPRRFFPVLIEHLNSRLTPSEGLLMQVYLEAIKFNHDPNSALSDAISIRKNEAEDIPVPEWQKTSQGIESFPAAYVRDAIDSNKTTVLARFTCSDKIVRSVDVQALCPNGGVLGKIPRTEVLFENGESDYVAFELPEINLREISVSTSVWTWQFISPSDGRPTPFAESEHQIFVLLTNPRSPWDTELPWSEVLEVACHWASGSQNADCAATAITHEVFRLGGRLLNYGRSSTYAHERFNCTAFLQLLRDGVGQSQTVNCDDCATIVSTFANILGCDLWQSGMGYDFATNDIRLIGHLQWGKIGLPRHAVAWKETCKEGDSLFDACLQVDADGFPSVGHQTVLQPTNLHFGNVRDKSSYKFCLFNSGQCDPDPDYEKRRRPLGKSYLGSRRFTSQTYIAFLKRHYRFNSWAHGDASTTTKEWSSSFLKKLTDNLALAGWLINPIEEFEINAGVATRIFLKEDNVNPKKLVEINLYQTIDNVSANDLMIQLLGEFHQLDLEGPSNQIGDVVFQDPEGTALLFKRARCVAIMRSVGMQSVSTIEMAQAI
ncbi:MAG TPA: hypothetical protein VJV03_06780 [Pyrinomonadaceae bacterium]|nr:hypothetical protein [Pyrinomonadaceae bacterium]